MGRYKRRAGIYTITCTASNKIYVGHSTNILKRLANHRNRLRGNSHNNIHLQAAWNLYGKNCFVFNIIEELPLTLTKQEYEEIETKWVLNFNSHKTEFGYNSILPGSFPLVKEDENKTSRERYNVKVIYLCIESSTGNISKCNGPKEVSDLIGVSVTQVGEIASYWKKLGDNTPHNQRKKSYKGWIIVREDSYNPDFDYVNYKKQRMFKDGIKKTWKDYYNKEDHRKNSEDIIPHQERKLKRVPIIATNIETGEEREFSMIKSCSPEFSIMKVYKCINNPFKKYKHRGHYFRKTTTGGYSDSPILSLSSSF